MKATVVTKKDWNIPKWMLKDFSEKKLEAMLRSFNNVGKGNYFFMDYFRQKLIVDSSSSLVLCGYSKEVADEQGFLFFENILTDDEWSGLQQLNINSYDYFFNYPESRRMDLYFSFDVTFQTEKGGSSILKWNVIPYKLCKNGNLWLGLCYVWESDKKESGNPIFTDIKTGEKYHFINNKLIKSTTHSLTEEELVILKCIVKELTDQQITERLFYNNLSEFKRKKYKIFEKLGAGTVAGAVHKAHLLGII